MISSACSALTECDVPSILEELRKPIELEFKLERKATAPLDYKDNDFISISTPVRNNSIRTPISKSGQQPSLLSAAATPQVYSGVFPLYDGQQSTPATCTPDCSLLCSDSSGVSTSIHFLNVYNHLVVFHTRVIYIVYLYTYFSLFFF